MVMLKPKKHSALSEGPEDQGPYFLPYFLGQVAAGFSNFGQQNRRHKGPTEDRQNSEIEGDVGAAKPRHDL